ncbi:MAG TPA: transglycosylase domain-containing protein, partial [Kribbella sp.]|uniref:transglycosylase domain-containing protein n=1 Tax=Kribbella sp. TaxID=1871183 RepID=UPI002D774549
MSEARRKAAPSRARRKKHWALRVLGWLVALFCLGVIGAAATFFIGYQLTDIPDPNKKFETNTTTVTYAGGQPMGSFFEQNRRSVPLDKIPKTVQDAVIAAEDRTFWTNPGISPSGMARAAFNIARGEQLQGGSTITQQYVKVMYLTQERTFARKFSELFIATKLSRQTDKKDILEGYLNTIYFGEGAYGIAAAGDAYFSQPDPAKLNVGQAAFLATVLNNPTIFDPDQKDAAAQKRILERYRYVLDGMRQTGTITESNATAWGKKLPPLKKKPKSDRFGGTQGFLLDMARRELVKLGFSDDEIDGGGLKVTTTFDKKLQEDAVAAVFNKDQPATADKLHIGLASVRPQTGELVAMVGGPNYLKSQINWATAKARPGSSFKPFAVAAALKDGVKLEDRFEGNGPIEIRGGKYDNELGENYGRPSLLSATEQSVNTAFYDLVDNKMDNGPSKVADMAEAAGIPTIPATDRDAPALVLGPNAYASPVDMASAYGTFANEGSHVPVHVIKEVKDLQGNVKWSEKSLKPTEAMDKDVANTTSYALQQVVEDKKGTGTRAQELDRPAAGKTGTAGGISSDHAKANKACKCEKYDTSSDTLTSWWVGYTPQLSTAVLYRAGKEGESDLDPYSDDPAFFGGNWPTKTWLAYMEPAMEGLPEENFAEPSDDNMGTPTPTYTPSSTPTPPPSTPP